MTEAELLSQKSIPAEPDLELNLLAFGVPYTLRLFDRDIAARVTSLLPRPSEPTAAPTSPDPDALFELAKESDGTVRVLQGPRQLLASRDLELSLWVLSDLVHEYVCYSATSGIFLRGAAVVYDGRAIVILGPPLSGRSTLAAELVCLGATHWADSYVLLDDEGQVRAFESPQAREANALAPDAGSQAGPSSLPIGLVVKTIYKPGTKWVPARHTTGEAMLELLAETVGVHARGAATMSALRKAVSRAVLLSGNRGEADEAAAAIIDALTGDAAT